MLEIWYSRHLPALKGTLSSTMAGTAGGFILLALKHTGVGWKLPHLDVRTVTNSS